MPGWVLVVSYESIHRIGIHRILTQKPFENGSDRKLISISLKFSIHGFESMESSTICKSPSNFRKPVSRLWTSWVKIFLCQVDHLRILWINPRDTQFKNHLKMVPIENWLKSVWSFLSMDLNPWRVRKSTHLPLKFSETCPSALDILGKNLPLPGWSPAHPMNQSTG